MLSPKKVRHRKVMKQVRHLHGVETRGTTLTFGDVGLMAVESGWISNRVIESARIAINRKVKRGGRMWIRVFPDKPLTKKPAEVRMGSGKGNPELWVAEIRAGRILYELKGVSTESAKEAFALAAAKFPLKTKVVVRREGIL